MATPHAAAVAALMFQADAPLTPDDVEATLETTGVSIIDARNGYAIPRIDAQAAVQAVASIPTPLPTPMPVSWVISGSITLQGRDGYSDTLVTLLASPCYTQSLATTSSLTDAMHARTNIHGGFTINVSTALESGCLHAARSGYLTGQVHLSAPEYTLELMAGDITGDNRIDIFDLVGGAALFGTTDVQGDFNTDGEVNILDLAIVASNYGKVGLSPSINKSYIY
jgi:hypothetical protein